MPSCHDRVSRGWSGAGALRGRTQIAVFLVAGGVIAGSLADNDAMVRAAAAAELQRLSDADLGAIAGNMAKLPAMSQVSVLAAIRIRGRSACRPPCCRRPRARTNRSAWQSPKR